MSNTWVPSSVPTRRCSESPPCWSPSTATRAGAEARSPPVVDRRSSSATRVGDLDASALRARSRPLAHASASARCRRAQRRGQRRRARSRARAPRAIDATHGPESEHVGPRACARRAPMADAGGRAGAPTGSATSPRWPTAAMPAEALSADELLACCWDDPGRRCSAPADGAGAIGAGRDRATATDGAPSAAVKLRGGAPGRAARGRRSRAAGASSRRGRGTRAPAEVHLGAAGAVLPLARRRRAGAGHARAWPSRAGYRDLGAALNMSVPHHVPGAGARRARRRAGARGRRRRRGRRRSSRRHWPEWTPETAGRSSQGSCFAAFDARPAGGRVRLPLGEPGRLVRARSAPTRRCRGGGVGHALLAEVCRDAMVAGLRRRRDLLDRPDALLRQGRRHGAPRVPRGYRLRRRAVALTDAPAELG